MLTSLALILLVGLAAASVCRALRLPPMVGMLAAGILLGPHALNLLDGSILGISADLRQMALVIILIKAGLSLRPADLKQVGRPALLMSFLPASGGFRRQQAGGGHHGLGAGGGFPGGGRAPDGAADGGGARRRQGGPAACSGGGFARRRVCDCAVRHLPRDGAGRGRRRRFCWELQGESSRGWRCTCCLMRVTRRAGPSATAPKRL